MKLIKQTELIFQGGTSDKVYEVDLCEVGSNQYVVNFRYGRRDSTLKEGTKTALPVALAKAEQVFDKLVASKVKKGYLDTQAPAQVDELSIAEVPGQSDDPREQAVLERLRAGDAVPEVHAKPGRFSRRRQKPRQVWPLNRAIWRAGELGLRTAEPLLIQFISATDHVRNYSIISALARCGTELSIPHLRRFYETSGFPDHVRRLAAAALLKMLPDADREAMRRELIERLPAALSDAIRQGANIELENALEAYLAQAKAVDYAVLPNLYLIDDAYTRPIILAWLRRTPLRPSNFKALRQIFKLAEFRLDAEVFGLLAYRLETVSAMFHHDPYDGGAWLPEHRRLYLEEDELRRELGSTNSRVAFSEKTRQYLRRRAWRTLRRLGELGSPDYVPMATGVLLMFSDSDAKPPFDLDFDAYGPYWAFNHILYRHSPRYVQAERGWRCRSGYKPGDPEPSVREEAFPELWQQAPTYLLRLLQQSHCHPVHAFAVKALRTRGEFCAGLDNAVFTQWLRSPYDCTAQLGFELAEHRFDASQPDMELVFAALVSRYALARERAWTWLEALSKSKAKTLLKRFFDELLSLDESRTEYAEALAATLLAHANLEGIELSTIQKLLAHDLVVLQQLGGEILLRFQENPPFALIDPLLNAEHETLRELGIRLLGQFPDAELAQHPELAVVLASHADNAMRAAATPLLRRLKVSHGAVLTELLILRLVNPRLADGVPSHVLHLLQTEFQSHLGDIGSELIWRLLRAAHSQAQELGGILLGSNVDPATVAVKQLVSLANHDVLAVRQTAQTWCRQSLPRLKQDMAETVKLLDATWDDSRAFAFDLLTEEMGADELSPDILVRICDSVREDVQQFGRRCITQYFQEADGQDYMLKLSEHPSADMQLFVTHYLECYAADNPERLQQLTPYFLSALSMVNRGRITKQRLYDFLGQEALKSEAAAQIVANILARQCATIAVGDRAQAIRILLRLQQIYPALNTPLQRCETVLR